MPLLNIINTIENLSSAHTKITMPMAIKAVLMVGSLTN
jgi:hypothetical protein